MGSVTCCLALCSPYSICPEISLDILLSPAPGDLLSFHLPWVLPLFVWTESSLRSGAMLYSLHSHFLAQGLLFINSANIFLTLQTRQRRTQPFQSYGLLGERKKQLPYDLKNALVEGLRTVLRETLQGRFPEGLIPILRPEKMNRSQWNGTCGSLSWNTHWKN